MSEVHLNVVDSEHPVDLVDDGQSARLYAVEGDDLVDVIALYLVVVDERQGPDLVEVDSLGLQGVLLVLVLVDHTPRDALDFIEHRLLQGLFYQLQHEEFLGIEGQFELHVETVLLEFHATEVL